MQPPRAVWWRAEDMQGQAVSFPLQSLAQNIKTRKKRFGGVYILECGLLRGMHGNAL